MATGTLLATVDIAAPPERVFRALTSKEVVSWWGSDEAYRTTGWEGDVRVGGRWRTTGKGADGSTFAVEGEYLEVNPPRRLVHTWQPDWDGGAPTTVRYALEAIDGGTRVTVRHGGFTDPASCAQHTEGWATVLDWLAAFATPPAAGAYFLIRLLSPRPSFMGDMNDQERRVMGEHVTYWTQLGDEGVAVAFGPVADPRGAWGVGLVEATDAAAIQRFEAGDPAIRAALGFAYEVLVMPRAIVRPR